jgi:hypothetical protein
MSEKSIRNAVLTMIITLACLVSCGKKAVSVSPLISGYGSIRLSISIAKPAALAKASQSLQTTWNKLIIRVSAPDMDTLTDTTDLSTSQLALIKSLASVKAGSERKVEVWTENSANQAVIHVCGPQAVSVTEGGATDLNLTLRPVKGSIYFDFWNIDSRIDTITARFRTATDTLTVRGVKAPGSRALLSIDYIPDGWNGTIEVLGIDCGATPWDTLYRYSRPYLFLANADSCFYASFKVYPGTINFDITFNLPGITVVQGYMNDKESLDSTEQGPVYISEIMYAVDDSEYVEIYNPLASDAVFDTLIVEVKGVYRKFPNVTVKAGGFFVIGRKALPFADAFHPTASALDLTSAGEFVALRKKDSTLVDCVYFTGGGNSQEWPVIGSSQRASIALDSLGGAGYNNFGKHWVAAVTPIPGTGLKGTPGQAGH